MVKPVTTVVMGSVPAPQGVSLLTHERVAIKRYRPIYRLRRSYRYFRSILSTNSIGLSRASSLCWSLRENRENAVAARALAAIEHFA
jgi:uncharacterized Fe-S cluster-containing radical SAM superfamily protein